ncbi:hypothetical protein [Cypionkella sp.]|uniref:hypothetical protein n=1 Tax=Cypionkella sp. TaxID=2811411 RepID=UPI002623F0EE|nr:hypothetical protein [Cypionkella sp.]
MKDHLNDSADAIRPRCNGAEAGCRPIESVDAIRHIAAAKKKSGRVHDVVQSAFASNDHCDIWQGDTNSVKSVKRSIHVAKCKTISGIASHFFFAISSLLLRIRLPLFGR